MAEGRHLELVENLRRVADRVAEQSGLEVVELSLRGPSRRRLLRVDIDRLPELLSMLEAAIDKVPEL